MQTLVVALLVSGCTLYAAWALMPAASRRGIATALLRLPLPHPVAGFMRRHATAASGCGCDGCDRNGAAKPAAGLPDRPVPLVFHPRRKP
ncbi:MAG: hypothetical protein K8R60_21160 [Burkholderiales bacterium]|nr:hypothetical protein [Burkholderiales bacterium]